MPSASVIHLLRQVIQRDGQRADFDASRIRSAMARAGAASGEFGDDEAALLTAQVVKVLVHRSLKELRRHYLDLQGGAS